jgi:Beta-lactamase superfamily domain
MMRVTLFGTRGSIAAPGPETNRYGGNTPAVEVRGRDGTVLVLDAGTGIRRLGMQIVPTTTRIDILLSHLHMDHIQGLGFFGPLYDPRINVHIWGPASSLLTLEARLARYLSPPLFPVHLRDLPSVFCHEVPCPVFDDVARSDVAGIGKQASCAFELQTGRQEHVVTSAVLFPASLGLQHRSPRAQLFPIGIDPVAETRPGPDRRSPASAGGKRVARFHPLARSASHLRRLRLQALSGELVDRI